MARINYPWHDVRDWTAARLAAECPLMFSFGSNVHPGQLIRRAPGCRFAGIARLNFARLRFYGDSPTRGGVATLRPSSSHEAWAQGILARVTADCIKEMDLREGNGTTYARHVITVIDANRQPVEAFTYLRLSNVEAGPDPDYVARIRAGFQFFGLDQAKLDRAVAHAPAFVARAEKTTASTYSTGGLAVRQPRQGKPTSRPPGGRLGGGDYVAQAAAVADAAAGGTALEYIDQLRRAPTFDEPLPEWWYDANVRRTDGGPDET